MIGPGEVMVAMIVIGLPTMMIAWAVNRTYRHKEESLRLKAQIAAAEAAENGARGDAAKLEQRVRVLERIVTDRGMDIAHEIEQLREPALEHKTRKPARARART